MRILEIMKPAAFIFLRIATVPSLGSAFFFSYTDTREGAPHFSPEFLGLLSVVGSLCGLIAIAVYNRYFSDTCLRRIFVAYGIMSFFSGLSDLVFVLRLNVKVGIPDKAFVLGDD